MGAAIAAGSQAEKGSWALLVEAAKAKNKDNKIISVSYIKIQKGQYPIEYIKNNENNIATSPKRLI